MQSLLEKIYNLQDIHTISKHEQIVLGIIDAIDAGVLKVGDKLPSINQMVTEVGYARKTFVKAYTELKERGLVESKNLKGYYIISEETNVTLKVALILFAYHSFQEDFYNTFRKELGKKYHIDIFFHHTNLTLFKTIMDNISRKYGMYVIAPIQAPEITPLLKKIPADRLLLIDRYLKMPKDYSYISQEFEDITYQKLVELTPRIKKYDRFVLFFKEKSDYPPQILSAFNRFIKDYNINGSVVENYESNTLKKKTAYFSIGDNHLWKVLKDARKSEYRMGTDIGIITYNDNIIKEIAFGGITTISTDFEIMAKKAATFVKERNLIQEITPTYLRQRNSL
ncbi:GntR family transcriptional regulator [Aquimarina sp. AD10]|uniref:GntR family transcriptional regulator n=1 Tax=Aquimarina TaxID=290174 RepID=UPI000E4BE674|nr:MULTISPECIES: GntR family transcriptional regulator [Aquimarina]AXT62610.1 GntR family transcriptional regulator [Aquimarina sp. AD10]RKM98395.1 GntR family transcriptional regulator [Aquimarina sp. AD10]